MFSAVNDIKEFGAWLVTVLILAFGFRYFKEIIAFVLEELYQVFIQNHPSV